MRNPFGKGICAVLLIGALAFSIPLFGEASSETALLAEQRKQRVLLRAKWGSVASVLTAVLECGSKEPPSGIYPHYCDTT